MDFITSAGFLNGRAQRELTGARGGGPLVVVTNLGLLEPDANGELVLSALHPGCTLEQVRENTGWQVRTSGQVSTTEPPLPSELQLLREELDPGGIYLKGS